MSPRISRVGAALAATGLSHFAKPQIFEKITAAAFPHDTRRHVYIDGAIETAIGLGLVAPPTRKLAFAGIAGYLAYLISGVVRNRQSPIS